MTGIDCCNRLGWFDLRIYDAFSPKEPQWSVLGCFFQVFLYFVVKDQFDICGRIVVDQGVEFRSFVHVVRIDLFRFITVDQDDIAGDKLRKDVTAVRITFGVNDSNRGS